MLLLLLLVCLVSAVDVVDIQHNRNWKIVEYDSDFKKELRATDEYSWDFAVKTKWKTLKHIYDKFENKNPFSFYQFDTTNPYEITVCIGTVDRQDAFRLRLNIITAHFNWHLCILSPGDCDHFLQSHCTSGMPLLPVICQIT